MDFSKKTDSWVCPNDRHLALRAKLKTGWSVKTNRLNCFNQPLPINESEQQTILRVVKRAETMDLTEQERIGRLVDRLENLKKHVLGNGMNQCILCGETFRILSSTALLCHDCRKAVCHKCVIESVNSRKEPIALCKICAETREMWKKSGAWFIKSIPKYVLPDKRKDESSNSKNPPSRYISRTPRPQLQRGFTKWAQEQKSESVKQEDDESSSTSEDEFTRRIQVRSKGADSSQDEAEIYSAQAKSCKMNHKTLTTEEGMSGKINGSYIQAESISIASDSVWTDEYDNGENIGNEWIITADEEVNTNMYRNSEWNSYSSHFSRQAPLDAASVLSYSSRENSLDAQNSFLLSALRSGDSSLTTPRSTPSPSPSPNSGWWKSSLSPNNDKNNTTGITDKNHTTGLTEKNHNNITPEKNHTRFRLNSVPLRKHKKSSPSTASH